MKSLIPRGDFADAAPQDIGDQIRINHVNCTAGEDRRSRLYVKRVDTNLVIAYCHNCGLSGWHLNGYTNVADIRRTESTSPVIYERKKVAIPADLEYSSLNWDTKAAHLLARYGITETDIHVMGLGYSPGLRRLVFPMWSEESEFLGYQTRRVFDDDPYPKYLTYFNRSEDAPIPHWANSTDLNDKKMVIVICEDLISGYKIHLAGYWPYVLMGCHLDVPTFGTDILNKKFKVVVWLDNDSNEIRSVGSDLANRLKLLNYEKVGLITNFTDPKRFDIPQIKEIVESCLK